MVAKGWKEFLTYSDRTSRATSASTLFINFNTIEPYNGLGSRLGAGATIVNKKDIVLLPIKLNSCREDGL